MAFDVSINIKANPQLQGTQAAEAAIEKIGATAKRINAEASRLPAQIQPVAPAVERVTGKVQGLSSAVAIVGTQLGGLGAGTSIAANALTSLVTQGFNPVSLVMTAVGLGLGLLIGKFNDASEAAKKLEETQIKAVESARKSSDVIRAIEAQGRLLGSADPELEGIKQKYAQQIKLAQDAGVGERAIGELRRQQAQEEDGFRARRFDAFVKEEQQRQKELEDLRVKAELLRQEAALKQIGTGQTAVQGFQQQFGASLGVDKEAGARLATQFVSVFNAFKDDPRAAAGLNQAFASLVQQATAQGLPDIPELLNSVGLAENDFSRLRQTLGGDLRTGLDQSRESGQQWGAAFDAELKKAIERAAEVGGAVGALDEKIRGITKEVALTMDVRQPVDAVEEIRARLAGIPDVIRKTIVIDTVQGGGGGLVALEQVFAQTTGLDFGTRVFN